MRYLKRIAWVLLAIAAAPIWGAILFLFLATCPIIILVRYIIEWEPFFDSVDWVMCEFGESIFSWYFGLLKSIKPE